MVNPIAVLGFGLGSLPRSVSGGVSSVLLGVGSPVSHVRGIQLIFVLLVLLLVVEPLFCVVAFAILLLITSHEPFGKFEGAGI